MITILILSVQTHPTHNASEVKTTVGWRRCRLESGLRWDWCLEQQMTRKPTSLCLQQVRARFMTLGLLSSEQRLTFLFGRVHQR